MRLALLVLLLWGSARADDDAARVHFLSGQAYYDQANYDDALREFAEAYRISQRPALLYNLALCYERLGRFGEAVASLHGYLDAEPQATDRTQVELRIQNLQARVVQPSPVASAPTTTPTPAPARKRVATWTVGAVGLGLLAAALTSGLVAELRYSHLVSDCGGGFSCSLPNLAQRKSEGQAAAIATDVLWPLGTAALVTAVVLFFYEGKPHPLHASAGGIAVAF